MSRNAGQSIVLTSEEIDEICAPLRQPSAQCRFLERLGVKVARRVNGHPLVSRQEFERAMSGAPASSQGRDDDDSGFNWSVPMR